MRLFDTLSLQAKSMKYGYFAHPKNPIIFQMLNTNYHLCVPYKIYTLFGACATLWDCVLRREWERVSVLAHRSNRNIKHTSKRTNEWMNEWILCRVAADVRSRICSCLLWHMRRFVPVSISLPLQSIRPGWACVLWVTVFIFCLFCFIGDPLARTHTHSLARSLSLCGALLLLFGCSVAAALCCVFLFLFVYSAFVVLHTPKNGCDYDYDRAAHCTWTLPF